jgi:rhodanese-related sulfurtransferase
MVLFKKVIRPNTLLAMVLLASILSLGCRADTSGLQTLSVEEVERLLADSNGFVLLDANGSDTREERGTIAQARLLSSYRDYDLSELSSDKSLPHVFYCYSDLCGAAADAARKAIAAGYEEVFVMPAGIKGWTEAGKPVADMEAS